MDREAIVSVPDALTGSKQRRGSKALSYWVRAMSNTQALEQAPAATLLSMVETQAALQGDALALIDESGQLTYSELLQRARFYAAWALKQGLGAGSVVCLMMPNCAEYVAVWLGVTHIGCVVSLINTNLAASALLHSVRVSRAQHIILSASLLSRIATIMGEIPRELGLWVHDGELHAIRMPSGPIVPATSTAASRYDPALLIFTSGTTGLPKAAYVTHARILEWSGWFAGMMDARPDDRLFNCLPMYHSVGGVVTTGAMLFAGGSMVIREKFSASNFWPDLVRNQCTIFQYIGELCRYLLAMPHQAEASDHRLRLCCGNGLREDVWLRFQSRFEVPRILEYYAATEGSVSLFNCEEMPGSIGRVPTILAHRFPVALIRLDETTRMPLRDEGGLCVRCSVNEEGEAIGRIDPESISASRRFDGYTDGAATKNKILRDVFVSGDAWFRTGDVMRCDEAGFFYFVDRLGSSFRWKGENVSASEVASIIMRCVGVVDAVVSGLAIEGAEGRVGVATVSTNRDFRPDEFRIFLKSNLPPYARPVLLRLRDTIPATSTFKLQETKATSVEWSIAARDGSLWFIRPDADEITPCDPVLLESILSGKIRL